MSVLTLTFTKEIEELLKSNYFLIDDFSISTYDYSNNVRLTIIYNYLPEYFFYGTIYKDEEKFAAEFSPGKITNNVKRGSLTKYDFLDAIQEWLNNAYAEMTKIPLARKVNEQEEMLKSFQEKIQNMDDEIGKKYFTKEEGEDLRNKLEKLEEELKEFIIKKDETENKQVKEIASLHADIETLKTQSLILNKKNWFLSLSVRIFNLFKGNPQFARQVAGFTREMLPLEAKDIVSEEALNQLFLPPSDGSSGN